MADCVGRVSLTWNALELDSATAASDQSRCVFDSVFDVFVSAVFGCASKQGNHYAASYVAEKVMKSLVVQVPGIRFETVTRLA